MSQASDRADDAVAAYLATLDAKTADDSRILIALMQGISKQPPQMWNVGTIGFDTYHYRYDSGREGDGHALGFYPRKGKITIYLMDGTTRHSDHLARLGKHTTSRVCVYVKRLSDVDTDVLGAILQDSYDYLKAHDGDMHRA